jgi:tRNA pseudouridine55 synthase
MTVIIMCGGVYDTFKEHKALSKVNGERLYRYARENKEVILPKREVYIYNLEVLDILNDSFTFKCTVSKGTYIRSLIRDIGDKLGIPCTMEKLNRIREGIFSIEESYTL